MIINYPPLSMKVDPYVVNNPGETKNAYTITEADKAESKLNFTDKYSIDDLKSSLKGYDFTSVTTDELVEVGAIFFEKGLIDSGVFGFFISGNMASDENGHQAARNVKYNAIAMFNQMFEERLAISGSYSNPGFHEITKDLLRTNHTIAALSFFAGSDQNDLSVSIKA